MAAQQFMKDSVPKEYRKTSDVVLPQTIVDEFARFLVPEIRKFYESEEGRREFAKWQEKQKSGNPAP